MSDLREEQGSYQPGESFCPPEGTRRAFTWFMIAAALVGTIMTAITARFGNPVAPYILGLFVAPLWIWVGARATFFPWRIRGVETPRQARQMRIFGVGFLTAILILTTWSLYPLLDPSRAGR